MLFKIKVFFQLHWLPQEAVLCVLSHILLVLHHLSHSHFLHCGSTGYVLELQLFGTFVFPRERVKLHLCSGTLTVVQNLFGSSPRGFDKLHNLQPQGSLAWRRPPQPKRQGGLHRVPSALSPFVQSCRGVGVTEYRLTFIPDRCPFPPTRSMRQEHCPAGGLQLGRQGNFPPKLQPVTPQRGIRHLIHFLSPTCGNNVT